MTMLLGGQPARGVGRGAPVLTPRDDADGRVRGAVIGLGDRACIGRHTVGAGELTDRHAGAGHRHE